MMMAMKRSRCFGFALGVGYTVNGQTPILRWIASVSLWKWARGLKYKKMSALELSALRKSFSHSRISAEIHDIFDSL